MKIKKLREAISNGEVIKEKTYAEENLEKVDSEFAANPCLVDLNTLSGIHPDDIYLIS